MKLLPWLLVALFTLIGRPAAQHESLVGARRAAPWPEETLALAARLPIQDGGRVKPLATFARFTLLRLNGKSVVETPVGEKLDATAWLLDTLFFPLEAAEYKCFQVENDEVIAAMGLRLEDKKKRDRYTLMELQPGLDRLMGLAEEYAHIAEAERTLVQNQIVILGSNVTTFLTLAGQLDFARLGIPVGDHPALAELFDGAKSVRFSQLVPKAGELRRLSESDAGTREAATQMLRFAGSVAGVADTLAILPPTVPAAEALDWYAPGDLFHEAYMGADSAPEHLAALAEVEELGRLRDDPQGFLQGLAALSKRLETLADARGEYDKVPLEVTYYKIKLIRRSLVFFVLAFVLIGAVWLRPRSKALYGMASAAAFVATLLVTGAIVMRCIIRGRPPVSTLYETLLFVTAVGSWTALVVEWINRRRIGLSASVLLGIVGLFLANGYETIDKQDTMPSLVAVLDTNFWLATHVTSITAGYAAGMLAALLANIYLVARLIGLRRADRGFYSGLARMVYGVIAFAVIFSTVGTILGGVWANDSWGRFWGWDPKENGALLIVLSQLVILHARMGGYLREHGMCMAAAFAGTIIAFSWFGVNLLGVGLHSYGFTAGINRALWAYYIFQWSLVGLGGLAYVLDQRRAAAVPQAPAEPVRAPQAGKKLAGDGLQA
jgi:ABC-type transport system involved in cytochrome c biogenesis permease subunit